MSAKPADSDAMQRTAALQARRGGRRLRIGPEGLAELAAHKYQSGSSTPLDRLMYAVWWQPLSNYVPPWLSPNALTLLGTAGAVASGALLWIVSPDLEGPTPAWAELLAVFLILSHQTCDALDGMQARKTGMSSPLGEILDHGGDTLAVTASCIGAAASLGLGFGLPFFVVLFQIWVPFWLAQWEAYHTGVVRTGFSVVGVTESQFGSAAIHLATAVLGGGAWRSRVDVPGLGIDVELGHLWVVAQGLVGVIVSVKILINMAWTQEGLRAKARALMRAMPMAVVAGITLLWPLTLPEVQIRFFSVSIWAVYTRLTCELILVHITREEYPSRQLGVALLPVAYAFGLLGLLEGQAGTVMMVAVAAACTWEMCWYLVDVVEEVATFLGVPIVRMARKTD